MERNTPAPHSHRGHRGRVRRHFLRHGLDGFYDHQALELLLFYGVHQRDVNETAHALLERFGSLRGVLEADGDKLMEFPYIKHRAAALMKLALPLFRRYEANRRAPGPVIDEADKAIGYLEGYFSGCTSETVYGLFLDAAQRVLSCLRLNGESERFTGLPERRVAAIAAGEGAAFMILARNRHGAAHHLPGPEENTAAERISGALSAIGVRLADHLICTADSVISLAEIGLLR